MSVFIDKKYISLLAPKLSQFKQRGEFLWNFRCPVCGDSHKNKIKARGYIYKRKEHFGFQCHNCGSSMGLQKFIKYVDPMLYNEYQLESFIQSDTKTEQVDNKEFITNPDFKHIYNSDSDILFNAGACRIKTFPPEFYARKYLEDRMIPLIDLWFTSDFKEFVRNLMPWNTKTLYNEPRIIIPFYDKEGNLIGIQGRSIGASKIKYITIKVNESVPKIFGWNRVDTSKTMYVCEGPLDSLFIVNSLATMDANLCVAASIVGLDFNYIFIYDNEPRNKQIVSNMRKTIAMGRKICVWPSDIKEKDINEMVMAGMHPSQIQHIIDNNTFSGIEATMKLNQWERL